MMGNLQNEMVKFWIRFFGTAAETEEAGALSITRRYVRPGGATTTA